MKKFVLLSAFALCSSAFAATVKVTSYTYIRSGEPTAELCGLVEGATSLPSYVRVQVDHRSARPATYNTIAGADGRFCISVITYRGTAEASVFGETGGAEAFIQ